MVPSYVKFPESDKHDRLFLKKKQQTPPPKNGCVPTQTVGESPCFKKQEVSVGIQLNMSPDWRFNIMLLLLILGVLFSFRDKKI